MRYALKFWLFRHSLLFLGFALVIGIIGIIWWSVSEGDWSKLLLIGGIILPFCYFLQKQQLEETRLMKELITDFNGRYGKMNEQLQKILEKSKASPESPLTPCDKKKCVDYFNLCAEEYLFYSLGYVEPHVWNAWEKGMKEYANKDLCIMRLWKQERKSCSYYGFEFPTADPSPVGENPT